MTRPFGVTLIAALFILSGGATLARTVADLDALIRPALIPAILFGNILIPIAGICAAFGLWQRLSWGWRLAATLAVSEVFFTIAKLSWSGSHSVQNILPMLWKVIIPLAIATYLLRAPLIVAFGWNKTEVRARRIEAVRFGLLLAAVGIIVMGMGIRYLTALNE